MEQLLNHLTPWYPAMGAFAVIILIRYIYIYVVLKILRLVNDKFNLTLFEDALKAFERPIHFMLWICAFYSFISNAPIETKFHVVFIEHILRSCFIFTFFWGIYNISSTTHSVMLRLLEKLGLRSEPSVGNIISTIIHIFIVMIAFVAIAKEWNYDITGFLASLSIGSVAVAFAAKDALANVFGSFIIILDKPFIVGDHISANGIEGIVEKITFRSTCVRTMPQELVYIPNSLLSNTPIINYNKREKRRIDFTLNFTYSSTREQLENVIKDITAFLNTKAYIFPDSIDVNFATFNSSSLDIRIICYSNSIDHAEFRKHNSDINLGLLELCIKAGLDFAFPSTSVYFENQLQSTPAENSK